MTGDPVDPEARWGMHADELLLTGEERRQFMESMEQMRRGEGRTVTSGELRGHHCSWCQFEDWMFSSFDNVLLVLLMVVVGIVALSTLVFVMCVVGGSLLSL